MGNWELDHLYIEQYSIKKHTWQIAEKEPLLSPIT